MQKRSRTQTVQKQQLLEEALLELMQTKGYAQTTVTDICRVAGIPRRTFYHYFDCKEAVVRAVMKNMLYECDLEVLLEFGRGFDVMQEGLVRNFQYWKGPGRRKLDLIMENGLSGEMTRCALQWLEMERIGLPRRADVSEKDLRIFSMVGTSSFFTLLAYWRRNEYRESPEEMAQYATRVLAEPLFHI